MMTHIKYLLRDVLNHGPLGTFGTKAFYRTKNQKISLPPHTTKNITAIQNSPRVHNTLHTFFKVSPLKIHIEKKEAEKRNLKIKMICLRNLLGGILPDNQVKKITNHKQIRSLQKLSL